MIHPYVMWCSICDVRYVSIRFGIFWPILHIFSLLFDNCIKCSTKHWPKHWFSNKLLVASIQFKPIRQSLTLWLKTAIHFIYRSALIGDSKQLSTIPDKCDDCRQLLKRFIECLFGRRLSPLWCQQWCAYVCDICGQQNWFTNWVKLSNWFTRSTGRLKTDSKLTQEW